MKKIIFFICLPLLYISSFRISLAQFKSVPKRAGSYMPIEWSIAPIIIDFLYWIFGVIGIVSMVGFVFAAILFATASGDESRVGDSGRYLSYSLIGIILWIGGVFTLQIIKRYLGLA